ncbi:MAG: ATP-binding protein [Myxococcota bacterium]
MPSWNQPPAIEVRAQRHKDRLISAILWSLLAATPIGLITVPYLASPPSYGVTLYTLAFAFAICALLLNRFPPPWWHPGAGLTVFSFLICLGAYWALGEPNSVVMLALATVPPLACLLWGVRPALVFGVLTLAVTLAAALSPGWNPNPMRASPLGNWIGFAMVMVVHALILVFSIRYMRDLLKGLGKSGDELTTLISSLPDGVVILRPDGAIASVNPAAQRLIGPESVVVGHPLHEVKGLCPNSVKRARRLIDSSMSGLRVDERLRIARGEKQIIVQARIGALPIGRASTGIVLALRDVTAQVDAQKEQEKLRHQVLRQQKLDSVGRLAGGIAHDFNNLLTIIRANAEFLDGEEELSPGQRECLDDLRHAAERCANFTQRLLTLSREHAPGRSDVQPDKIAASVIQVFARTLRPNLKIEEALGAREASIRGNLAEVEAAILNLLLNARDALKDSGAIRVVSDVTEQSPSKLSHLPVPRRGLYYRLRVTDDGKGMDADTLEHATEPFFTTKGAGQGTGLGLATVYQLMKQLDGGLELESEPGRGTTISLYVPIEVAHERVVPTPAAVPAEIAELRILLVEDDPAVRATTTRALVRGGYEVQSVECGASALRWIEEHGPPDILLSDILLPGMSGIELAARLSDTHRAMQVLHISGFTGSAAERPVHPMLPKPFAPAELLAFLREHTAEPIAQSSN